MVYFFAGPESARRYINFCFIISVIERVLRFEDGVIDFVPAHK